MDGRISRDKHPASEVVSIVTGHDELCCRRQTARHVMSVEIVSTAITHFTLY